MDWHKLPVEGIPLDSQLLLTVQYADHAEVHMATYGVHGVELDESGEDYWTASDIRSGEAKVTFWALCPEPCAGD